MFVFRNRYEEYDPHQRQLSADKAYYPEDASSPESFHSMDRPRIRTIDNYIRPELPCLSKRMTVALLSCIGFIIMFGMRSSMSVVNMENVGKCD